MLHTRALIAGVLLAASGTALAAPHISTINNLPWESQAHSTSESGRVVSGFRHTANGDMMYRWSGGVMTNIGTMGGSVFRVDVSGDGSTVVGSTGPHFGSAGRAVRWTGSELEVLGTLGGNDSAAYGVSRDGSAIAGTSTLASGAQHAFRWTSAGGMRDLGTLGGDHSFGNAISADGAISVGYSTNADGRSRAFRWNEAVGMQDLGSLIGNYGQSQATGTSADGSVVVGGSDAPMFAGQQEIPGVGWGPTSKHMFRWTQDGGMQDLGGIGMFGTTALGVSADGNTVVGFANAIDPMRGSIAAMWTAETGLVDLQEYLSSRGVDMSGWRLTRAYAASADGTTVVGRGFFDQTEQAFVITGVPAPGAMGLLVAAGVLVARRRRD